VPKYRGTIGFDHRASLIGEGQIPQMSAGKERWGATMPNSDSEIQRATMLELFDAAVAAAKPAVCLPPHLPAVPDDGRISVLGAGKAAAAMALAAERHYRAQGHAERVAGFVTTRHGHALPTEIIEVSEAGHPVPDANSLRSATRALDLAKTAGPGDLVLVLLSGGASALWAAPALSVGLEAKQALTTQLLKAGARISEINCVRKHLSRIKGGKLAAAAHPAHLLTLAISDVPGDDPAIIGSGPTVGDPTTLAEASDVLQRYGLVPSPEVITALSDPANETPKPGAPALASAEYKLIAAPKAALEAAARLARGRGYLVEILGDALEGEARQVATAHAALALQAKQRGQRVAILSGGELTVTVRGEGEGGPNQEYALALAIALDGAPGIAGLAADTDGADGGENAWDPAGALVLPDTLSRAAAAHLNAATFLANNDSTAFFRAIGDLVQCGPTQTNVNDFRAILVDP
jgi:glycerate 2-kinase